MKGPPLNNVPPKDRERPSHVVPTEDGLTQPEKVAFRKAQEAAQADYARAVGYAPPKRPIKRNGLG
jgi:hypothetical protein